MAKGKNPRSRAREIAFKLIFEEMFGTNTASEMLGTLFEEEIAWNESSD